MSGIVEPTRPVLAVALLATSIGCGAQSIPISPSPFSREPVPIAQPAPQPGQPASNIVPAANDGIPGVHRLDVVASRSGTATVMLRWPNGDFSLQLYVTSGACPDVTGLLTGLCSTLGKTRPGDRPGVVASTVTSGELNTIWVLNSDASPQPFTIDIRIE
jgi:hypothetical protein